jgi:hypothetical protein
MNKASIICKKGYCPKLHWMDMNDKLTESLVKFTVIYGKVSTFRSHNVQLSDHHKKILSETSVRTVEVKTRIFMACVFQALPELIT